MVGPLDSQIVINQSAVAGKVQEVQQRHPDLQQRHFALQLEEEQEKKQQDVRNMEKTDQALIRDRGKRDEKGRKPRRSRRSRLQKGGVSLSEEKGGEETGGQVDIFV